MIDPFALTHNDFVDRYRLTLQKRDQRFVGPTELFSRTMTAVRQFERVLRSDRMASTAKRQAAIHAVVTDAFLRSRAGMVVSVVIADATWNVHLYLRGDSP